MPGGTKGAAADLGAGGVLPLAAARARLAAEPAAEFAELFRHGTLSVELYAPRGTDRQQPHGRDELYVVASGQGEFVCDGRRQPCGPGDLIFVPARAPHRFERFSDDFSVWVAFYGPEGGEAR
jgi:mannose-6-phosphate isomerase-like protein (cupin superfamily)